MAEPLYALKKDLDMLRTELQGTTEMVAQEVMSHTRQLYQMNQKLEAIAREVESHSIKFVYIYERFDQQDKRMHDMNAKLDRIMAHLGIS